MNTFAENIKNNLTNDRVVAQIDALKEKYPNYSFAPNGFEISIVSSIRQFHYTRDVLLESIESGDFDTLPMQLQQQISESIETICHKHVDLNNFIARQQNLFSLISTSGFEDRLKNFNQDQDILSNLSSFKRASQRSFKQAEKYSQETIQLLDIIKANEQEIENRKKNVIAFAEHIETYKKDIDNKKTETQQLIDKLNNQQKVADALIASAEEALKLKSAEGISAALSAQYEKNTSKWTTWPWIGGALAFIGVAIYAVFLLATSESGDSINAIISRITVILITISAATFCANRYTRQKRIAEDYAYKAVLAKSIVAFTEKLKEYDANDGKKSGDFLAGAIKEINRSPAREGEDKDITKNLMELLKNNKN